MSVLQVSTSRRNTRCKFIALPLFLLHCQSAADPSYPICHRCAACACLSSSENYNNVIITSVHKIFQPVARAVARILFQLRQRGEPGVWRRSPQRAPGQSPWSEGQGTGPPERLKLKAFQQLDGQRKWEKNYNFHIYGLFIIHQKLS